MSRRIGTPVESAVVQTLRLNGWPHAERRALHGSKDLGDVTGTPGLVWEVKGGKAAENASDGQVWTWLEETEQERRNANADYGILVMKRKGIGAPNASRWWAVMDLSDWARVVDGEYFTVGYVPVRLHLITATQIFRRAGYGDPL